MARLTTGAGVGESEYTSMYACKIRNRSLGGRPTTLHMRCRQRVGGRGRGRKQIWQKYGRGNKINEEKDLETRLLSTAKTPKSWVKGRRVYNPKPVVSVP